LTRAPFRCNINKIELQLSGIVCCFELQSENSKMPDLLPVLTKDDIDKLVGTIARRISLDYKDRELVLIGVLKGAFIFLSDLIQNLTIPAKVDFVGASSYSSGTSSSGNIRLTKEVDIDLRNKDILIVEDIVDTGLTLFYIVDYLKSFNPKTIKICTLVDKHERREAKVNIDYACHVHEKGFLVGYGLDYLEDYRDLPGIYHLKI
jgi:hypoxanthine phosphoribosyltransferase